jgi:NAD(P)-dependent dehydrogenase (short-subunit alcohol dehydrogenase family)
MRTTERRKEHGSHKPPESLSEIIDRLKCRHPARGPLQDFPPEKWDAIIAINLSSAFHNTQLALLGDTPKPAAVADAARYMKTLRDSGQLAIAGGGTPARGATHQIERDPQGRQVLRRKRFSIS